MAPFEGTTQIFLDHAYEKVLDKLVSSFHFDHEKIEKEDYEDLCEELDIDVDYDRLSDGFELDEDEEIILRRKIMRPHARNYVCSMMDAIFDESDNNGVFTEEGLDGLCANIRDHGLAEDRAELVFKVTKEVFFEDLFDANPVYLKRNDKWYSIHKSGRTIYVLQQAPGL